MKYKLIAIDMDGTLLNSERKVSDKNRNALLRAKKKGIHIVLSTGRILGSALYFSRNLGLNNHVIACNGALIYYLKGQNFLYENSMDVNTVKEIVELAEKNSIYYYFYDKFTFYLRECGSEIFDYYKYYEKDWVKQGIEIEIFQNPIDILEHNRPTIYKFVFIDESEDKLLDFREKLKQIKGISISSSWYNNIEVMSEGVSKGTALEYLIKELNIAASEVVAIGDNENDISMFKVAGLAIGMKNGIVDIKDYVDVITDTNDEDGVAKAIEKYVINQL
ncbi:Cof-type HAD-IIB family hydrolase [Tepidimicrobium xylanilyticum]|uniref:Cof-type HAD-IIB family hydrolase n=1 Tax=Tepidimicrobium xylanilyticum TaxID=1123352 RepID=UPI00265724FD|nr:Cof-type HAD-IIB family hydrolase [Tepidimicrobium xylanilyticum]GMG96369.1 haloacid dehalogenase [Tepidimicrobium xylanilyticum]